MKRSYSRREKGSDMWTGNIFNVTRPVKFDESITEYEYRTYSPYLANSLDQSDEIRIPIQNQDALVVPGASFILLEGVLDKSEDATATFVQNAFAFLFDEVRYELGGITIDEIRNVGITTTMKGHASLSSTEFPQASNYGWGEEGLITDSEGNFNVCIPLSHLLGFAEDYKEPIINMKHELVLLRGNNDKQCIVTRDAEKGKKVKINLRKLAWKIPHVKLSDENKLGLLQIINSPDAVLQIPFRSWNINELPTLQTGSQSFSWPVRSSNQLEKARWILFALQVSRNNDLTKNSSEFDHADLSELQVQLNSVKFPYEPLTMNFEKQQFALAYQGFSSFQKSYYSDNPVRGPVLSKEVFKSKAPIFIINCSKQEEAIKAGSVELKIEFRTRKPMAQNTKAFAVILHDRVIEYSPLYQTVRRM